MQIGLEITFLRTRIGHGTNEQMVVAAAVEEEKNATQQIKCSFRNFLRQEMRQNSKTMPRVVRTPSLRGRVAYLTLFYVKDGYPLRTIK